MIQSIDTSVADTASRTEENELLERVQEILPEGKYNSLRVCNIENSEAGTRACFRANWNGRSVFLKVDKTPRTKNANRHFGRGYNTAHEIEISSLFQIDEALSHNISPVIEHIKKDGLVVSVELDFEGSQSLKRYRQGNVQDNSTNESGDSKDNLPNIKDFRDIFSKAIIAVDYATNEKGIHHRDMSPYNILVRKNEHGLEVRVTDWTNAIKVGETHDSVIATAGARIIRDPLLNGKFNEKNEVYALAHNALMYLTGEPAVEYDPDNFNFNPEIHNEKIKAALAKTPRWAKKHRKVLWKALCSDEKQRYNSISKFEKAFLKASKPGVLERLKNPKFLTGVACGLVGLGAIAITGINALQEHNAKNLETAVAEASRYKIASQFDGSNLEIVSNLLDLKISVQDKETGEFLCGEDKKPDYLSLRPGQKLSIIPHPRQKPRPDGSHLSMPSFKGRVYIEGYPGKEFTTDSLISDPSAYDDFGGPFLPWIDFEVPKEMQEGNYCLVMELDPQDKQDPPNVTTALSEIRYENPGKAINRPRIPIVIGNPKDKLHLESLRLDYTEGVSFRSLEKELWKQNPEVSVDKDIDPNTVYEVSVPEIGFARTVNLNPNTSRDNHYFGLGIPKPEDDKERTLQIVAKQNGKVVGYTFFPITGKNLGGQYLWWKVASPSPEFSDNLVGLRKKIYESPKESHK